MLMDPPLFLYGDWTCALFDIQYGAPVQDTLNLWIYSNLCKESVVGDAKKPLLRRVHRETGTLVNKTLDLLYAPVRKRSYTTIRMYIRGDQDEVLSFAEELVSCTLHFKRD